MEHPAVLVRLELVYKNKRLIYSMVSCSLESMHGALSFGPPSFVVLGYLVCLTSNKA